LDYGVPAQIVYVVPAGYVLLLKSIVTTIQAGVGVLVLYYISGGGATPYIHKIDPLQPLVADVFELWVALNGGDYIVLSKGASVVDYWLSGALLPWGTGAPGLLQVSDEQRAFAIPLEDLPQPPTPS